MADPDKGPVWVLKLDVVDAFHISMIQLSQVEDFAYIIHRQPTAIVLSSELIWCYLWDRWNHPSSSDRYQIH